MSKFILISSRRPYILFLLSLLFIHPSSYLTLTPSLCPPSSPVRLSPLLSWFQNSSNIVMLFLATNQSQKPKHYTEISFCLDIYVLCCCVFEIQTSSPLVLTSDMAERGKTSFRKSAVITVSKILIPFHSCQILAIPLAIGMPRKWFWCCIQLIIKQLERLHSIPPPSHDHPYYWFISDPKSKEDVKVTNLKMCYKFKLWNFTKQKFTHDTPSEVAW